MRVVQGREAQEPLAGLAAGGGEEAPALAPATGSGTGARAAHAYGAFVHSIIFSLGLVFLLHVASVGITLNAQGHWSSSGAMLSSLRDALILLLRNFLLPFAEASFLDPMMPESSSMDVWGFWVPGLLSLFLLTIASLGLATIRWRRPSRAVPYAMLAAVFLVWQAQVSQSFVEISAWADLGTERARLSPPQRVQQYLFKAMHESFAQQYGDQQCKVAQKVDSIPRLMTCSGTNMEAKLMPLIVQEFCRAHTAALEPSFDVRVGACKEQGQRLKLFSASTADRDAIYCRCWTALFDALQIISRWIMFVWCGLLVGVLSVLYIAAEPKLQRMCAREQSEVLCFAAISMALLACRVTVFPEGLPWSKGAGRADLED